MNENKMPEGFSPILPDSDLDKMMEKFKKIDSSIMATPQLDYSPINKRKMNAMFILCY